MSEEKKNEKVESTEPAKKVVAQRKSTKEKLQLLAKFHKLCKNGKTAMDAAKEIGVPYITLHYWSKYVVPTVARGAKAKQTPIEKPAQEKPKKAAKKSAAHKVAKLKVGAVVITFPNGMKVECATPKDAAAVLSAL